MEKKYFSRLFRLKTNPDWNLPFYSACAVPAKNINLASANRRAWSLHWTQLPQFNLDSSNRWYLSSRIQVTFYHISQALHDKSFSEEVFEGIDQEGLTYTTAATLPRSELPEQHESNTRVWKSRTPSETASLHSHDASSVHGSTVSRDYRVLAEQKSYYSSFKPQKASSESQSQISTNSDSIREKIATHSVKTSGTKKVFTFDLK